MKMIKKIFFSLLMLFGIFVAIVTSVAIRVTENFDSESIDLLSKYFSELSNSGGMTNFLTSEAGLLFILYKIKEFSHWIYTGCILWIVLTFYFLIRKENKNEKK